MISPDAFPTARNQAEHGRVVGGGPNGVERPPPQDHPTREDHRVAGRRRDGGDEQHLVVAFLLVRLAEDETVVLAAIEHAGTPRLRVTDQVAEHIALRDPDRVLREVAAKRTIVRLCTTSPARDGPTC